MLMMAHDNYHCSNNTCVVLYGQMCDPIWNNPAFSKIGIFISWYSRRLKPFSVVVSSSIILTK